MTTTEVTAQRLPRYRLAPGDIVCVRTGTLGRHALVHPDHNGWLFGTGCLRLRRDVLGALDAKIAIHRDIGNATTALRDALLPALLTGEIAA